VSILEIEAIELREALQKKHETPATLICFLFEGNKTPSILLSWSSI